MVGRRRRRFFNLGTAIGITHLRACISLTSNMLNHPHQSVPLRVAQALLLIAKWIRDPEHHRTELKRMGFHKTEQGWSDAKIENSPGERSLLKLERVLDKIAPGNSFEVLSQARLTSYNQKQKADKAIMELVQDATKDDVKHLAAKAGRLFRADAVVKAKTGRPPFPFYIESDGIQHQADSPSHYSPAPDKPSQIHTDRVKDCCARLNHGGVMLRFSSNKQARKKSALVSAHATRYCELLQAAGRGALETRLEVQRFCDAACFCYAGGLGIAHANGGELRNGIADYGRFTNTMVVTAAKAWERRGAGGLTPEQDKLFSIWGRETDFIGGLQTIARKRPGDQAHTGHAMRKLSEYRDLYQFCGQVTELTRKSV